MPGKVQQYWTLTTNEQKAGDGDYEPDSDGGKSATVMDTDNNRPKMVITNLIPTVVKVQWSQTLTTILFSETAIFSDLTQQAVCAAQSYLGQGK